MTTRRSLASAIALASTIVLLSACGSSTSEEATASASVPAPSSVAASPAASDTTGEPSAELAAWAGAVCDDTAALRDSVTGIANAITAGGTDVGATLQTQFTAIGAAAGKLADTAQAIPADGSSPEAVAVKESADESRAAIDALGASINELTSSDGLGAVAALAGVGAAAKGAVDAIGSTAGVIESALKDGKGVVGQAFAASPSCQALTQ